MIDIQYVILVVFVIGLIVYVLAPARRVAIIEGLDNGSSSASNSDTTGNPACDSSLVSFQNSGSIQSLKDTVNRLTDQVSALQKTQIANTSAIEQLQTQATKFDNLAEQAEELATQNKQRLMELAQQSQQQYSDAKDQMSAIPDIQGDGTGASTATTTK